MKLENMNEKKAHAAYLLSDELYASLKSVTLAHRLLNNAFEYRVDDEELGKMGRHEALYRLSELSWRMDLLVHQICEAEGILAQLENAGTNYIPSGNVAPASQCAEPKFGKETIARVRELITDLGHAEQQRVLEIFGVGTDSDGEDDG